VSRRMAILTGVWRRANSSGLIGVFGMG